MAHAKDIAEVVRFTTAIAGPKGFQIDADPAKESASWSTRDHGDVGEEAPGDADIRAAKAICAQVEGQFDNVRASVDTCDEWTNLGVQWFSDALPPRKASSQELNKRLHQLEPQIAAILLAAGRITKEWHVSVPSTGRGLSVNSNPREVGYYWDIQIFKTGSGTQQETIHFQVGRHQLELQGDTAAQILQAFESLGASTDQYKDVYPYHHAMAVKGGYLTDPWSHRGIRVVTDIEQAYKFEWTGNQQGLEAVREKYQAEIVRWRRGYPPEAMPKNESKRK